MSVALRHPRTGAVKVLPEGWSWGCCMGSLILGLPLFRLGLATWGAAMVAFNIVALVVGLFPTARAAALGSWLWVIGVGLALFLGAKANEMALRRHLALGWEYAEPRRRSA